MIKRNS